MAQESQCGVGHTPAEHSQLDRNASDYTSPSYYTGKAGEGTIGLQAKSFAWDHTARQ